MTAGWTPREIALKDAREAARWMRAAETQMRAAIYAAYKANAGKGYIAGQVGVSQSTVSTIVLEESLREYMETFGFCPNVNTNAADHWGRGSWSDIEELRRTGKVSKKWFEEMLEHVHPGLREERE
ncbi:hypothetical protein E3_1350 [Rhodococcus phage E3]|uniref:hypothetical protein n=1 Tax=Rhodococcus phage E3 TaxID=1007869 RepID=UPI0002C6BE09|nr:hypothetical protein M176_gp143 [Rhodococcus phage E3]AEQ21051.1 hypothetical protein E3_1350 [Rhodococcus phage E3]